MASIIASAFASEAVEQAQHRRAVLARRRPAASDGAGRPADIVADAGEIALVGDVLDVELRRHAVPERVGQEGAVDRSEEHTSELQSLMRISYAVFCLKKKKTKNNKK